MSIAAERRAISIISSRVTGWANSSSKYYLQTLESLTKHFRAKMDTPFRDLSEKVQKAILFGTGSESVVMTHDDGLRRYQTTKPFEGLIPNMERRFKETDSAWAREELSYGIAVCRWSGPA